MTRTSFNNPATVHENLSAATTSLNPINGCSLDDLLTEIQDIVVPLWPLKDYVAVNPYGGLAGENFMEARSFLRVFSDCETLMPVSFFADQFHKGQFTLSDIDVAIREMNQATAGSASKLTANEVVDKLQVSEPGSENRQAQQVNSNHRSVKTMAELVDRYSGTSWGQAIGEEISKHCSAHYDQGQSVWSHPFKHLGLFESWQLSAQHDRNIEILGLSGFRKFVAKLPQTAEAAIRVLLQELGVPQRLWEALLLCQAFSVQGWCSWAKYNDRQRVATTGATETSGLPRDLIGLLAIRLAYDVAVAKSDRLEVNWNSMTGKESATFPVPDGKAKQDSELRFILLHAQEIGYRNRLLNSLDSEQQPSTQQFAVGSADSGSPSTAERKLAQLVFCIDVRSERLRRSLESRSHVLETFGFAGFFGMPIEFVQLGQQTGDAHVPALLQPEFQLHQGLNANATGIESLAIANRQNVRAWRKLWKSFQGSAIGCFSFVETTGLLYSWTLLRRALGIGMSPNHQAKSSCCNDGIDAADRNHLGPTLRGLNQQGITTSRQTELAESMLRNLGLTSDFARLVVFCGHASQTENNPLAAGLDCGACGGHSGEPNARLAAMLLNQPYIRESLAKRGLIIPADTHFLSAVHNTTTDQVQYFDMDSIPDTHRGDLEDLIEYSKDASELVRQERLVAVDSREASDLFRRATDWSEVRPEWGLAGNAAFIVGPRALTKRANLDGRSFLHSYDHRQDPEGKILESIMTAPMIVAHWINMQYYASTVDQQHFGSGTKTIHNVVGRFGILSGNGGDLMTGLPWQSLHGGDSYQHIPMRLQAVIAAPRSSIQQVIDKHETVADLLNHGWLHLISIENDQIYRFTSNGAWQLLESKVCSVA